MSSIGPGAMPLTRMPLRANSAWLRQSEGWAIDSKLVGSNVAAGIDCRFADEEECVREGPSRMVGAAGASRWCFCDSSAFPANGTIFGESEGKDSVDGSYEVDESGRGAIISRACKRAASPSSHHNTTISSFQHLYVLIRYQSMYSATYPQGFASRLLSHT